MTPASSALLWTQFRTIDGLSIRFAESEDRNTDALLLSAWPESVFAYEPIWSRLAEHMQLVAIDLPGFGRSTIRGGIGHNLPREAPQALAEAVVEVDGYVT